MRSGKEVGDASSSKKKIMNEDDDEGVADVKVDDGMKYDKNNRCGVEEKTTQKVPCRKDEPKVDLKTLPFPQRFIRRNLDK